MSLTHATFHFPFVRESWYSLKELSDFEHELSLARDQDIQLNVDLRLAQKPWMKLRNEELCPLRHFARHIHLTDKTQFKICPEGAEVDLELKDEKSTRKLQVTLAGPIWTPENPNWGYSNKRSMEKLNREGATSGWWPFRKERDGSISNREEVISTEERDKPYFDGLVKTLQNKQNFRIPDCDLIINAVAYCEAMNQNTFVSLANKALSTIHLKNFRTVYILDYDDGYFVEQT